MNIGIGTDVSIADLAVLVRETTGFAGDIVFDRSKPDGTPRKLMDVSLLSRAAGRRARRCRSDCAWPIRISPARRPLQPVRDTRFTPTMPSTPTQAIVIQPVVLAGGSGTRLWPLSRAQHPKQFLVLSGNRSLFQQATVRLAMLGGTGIEVAPLAWSATRSIAS